MEAQKACLFPFPGLALLHALRLHILGLCFGSLLWSRTLCRALAARQKQNLLVLQYQDDMLSKLFKTAANEGQGLQAADPTDRAMSDAILLHTFLEHQQQHLAVLQSNQEYRRAEDGAGVRGGTHLPLSGL